MKAVADDISSTRSTMDSGRSTTTFITVAAVTVAVGLAAYAVYFDHKRRNDTEFRRKLKKEKKRVQKSVAQNKESEVTSSTSAITPVALREALQQVKDEETPKTPEEKETYFMAQVGLGEQLAAQGPTYYLPAAMAFYRALRVYPSPVELIVIYQKTIVEPVFKLVMDMTNLDVTMRIEAYYDYFPPKRTNVSIIMREATAGQAARHVLVVNKDFSAGEMIYKEFPVVTALDSDLQSEGTYCGQCLCPIEPEMAHSIKDASASSFPQTYCSKACVLAAKKSHNILFTLDPPLPPEIPAPPPPPDQVEARQQAQAKFAGYLKQQGRSIPLLVARFIARQVGIETEKLVEATNPSAKRASPAEHDFTDSDNTVDGYSLSDHIERFRYLEAKPNLEEKALLAEVLNHALPGLEEFITEEKHTVLAGKMSYNAFGVCYGGGRDDKPEPTARPEDLERTRTPYGTQRQIGSALYTVSSYLAHSCVPSALPSFSSGTSEISIIANRDLKNGDELTIAFVDVTQHTEESVLECRRRRRFEIARGWGFACQCKRCVEEGEKMSVEEKAGAVPEQQVDQSKLENSVKNYGQVRPRENEEDFEQLHDDVILDGSA